MMNDDGDQNDDLHEVRMQLKKWKQKAQLSEVHSCHYNSGTWSGDDLYDDNGDDDDDDDGDYSDGVDNDEDGDDDDDQDKDGCRYNSAMWSGKDQYDDDDDNDGKWKSTTLMHWFVWTMITKTTMRGGLVAQEWLDTRKSWKTINTKTMESRLDHTNKKYAIAGIQLDMPTRTVHFWWPAQYFGNINKQECLEFFASYVIE